VEPVGPERLTNLFRDNFLERESTNSRIGLVFNWRFKDGCAEPLGRAGKCKKKTAAPVKELRFCRIKSLRNATAESLEEGLDEVVLRHSPMSRPIPSDGFGTSVGFVLRDLSNAKDHPLAAAAT